MKKFIPVILICVAHFAHGQIDTLQIPVDSLTKKVTQPVDSVNQALNGTLTAANGKVDSIEQEFNHRVDSLNSSYQETKSKIEGLSKSCQQTIDSLNNLNLPTEKYTARLDSLNGALQQKQQAVTGQIAELQQKAMNKLKSLEMAPELEQKVTQVAGSITKVDIPGIDPDILSKLNTSGLKTPSLDLGNLGNISPDLPDLNLGDTNIKDISVPSVDGIPQLPGAENLGNLGDITQQAGQYGNDVKAIASGDLGEVKQVPELIENKVGEMADVKGLQDQASQIPINPAMSEEEAKAQIKEQVKKVAVDHFAGHEDKLKEAMDKIAKYKQKYSEVQSLKDLPKKVPNAMKGKPLRERLVPGVTLQFQRKNEYLLDVSPSVGYRFSGRITAGLGWNQRWAYDHSNRNFSPGARIFGPRTYGEFKIKKGFSVRAEAEYMNTFVPPKFKTGPTEGNREWVPGFFTGIKKDYKFLKHVRGNVQIMYNLYDPHYKSPYADKLNMRIGFEFPQKKRKTKKTEEKK